MTKALDVSEPSEDCLEMLAALCSCQPGAAVTGTALLG